jgi:hypothetical protein
MKGDYLFNQKGYLYDYLESKKLKIKEEIYGFDEDYILNVSEDDLVKALTSKYMLKPPVLKLDEKYQLEPKEIDVDVSRDPSRYISDRRRPFYIKGTLITVIIPFDGDEELFCYSPSPFIRLPMGRISKDNLIMEYKITSHNPELLKKMIDDEIQLVQNCLSIVKKDVDNFNNSLENYIRNLVKTRKEKLLKDRNLASSLDIPIRRRSDVSWTYSVTVKPKKISVELPKVKSEKFEPEPALAIEIYEEILKILENMILTMERSPKTFSKLKEEELRNFLLVILNANFEGEAMGEVFNYMGKTDILIRHKNSNVFIAECKFWRGEKAFLEAIDQLFRYVTWRDTKLAILIFNRDGNLKTILEKIPQLVKSHPFYKRTIKIDGETKFRYVLHVPNDRNREVILTIMVFDIPKEKTE